MRYTAHLKCYFGMSSGSRGFFLIVLKCTGVKRIKNQGAVFPASLGSITGQWTSGWRTRWHWWRSPGARWHPHYELRAWHLLQQMTGVGWEDYTSENGCNRTVWLGRGPEWNLQGKSKKITSMYNLFNWVQFSQNWCDQQTSKKKKKKEVIGYIQMSNNTASKQSPAKILTTLPWPLILNKTNIFNRNTTIYPDQT